MATTFVIACPDCAKQVKVSEEHLGKRIKCKGCGTVYPVKDPAESNESAGAPKTKATPPAAPRTKMAPNSAAKAAPPPAPPKPKPATAAAPEPIKQMTADDLEYDPNKYTLTETNDNLPRCPFCAKEMESHEALICLHCGYNTRTRTRPEVRHVYQHTAIELFLWWLPGILCVLTIIGLLVWYIIFWNMIEDWMAGSVFEDEPGPPRTFLAGLGPGFVRLYQALIILFLYVPLFRFAYKRLVLNNKPRERRIKEDWV